MDEPVFLRVEATVNEEVHRCPKNHYSYNGSDDHGNGTSLFHKEYDIIDSLTNVVVDGGVTVPL